MSAPSISLPRSIDDKLKAIRLRQRTMVCLAGTVAAATFFCGIMLASMLVDWWTTPFSTLIRMALTGATLAGGATAWFYWGLRPFTIQTSLPNVAGLIEATVPQLEERWTTITDLSQNNDPPEMRGSTIFMGQVTREAEELHCLVDPQKVISTEHLRRNLQWLGAVLAVFVCGLLLDSRQVIVLFQRFWLPTTHISLTQISTPHADSIVPRFEPFSIEANLQQRVRDAATIWIRDEAGRITTHPMSRTIDQPDQFKFHITSVDSSFEFRIRSGDGQTPWHKIQAIERPRIVDVDFQIIPPKYSKLHLLHQHGLPHRLRALEGSSLEIVVQSSEPLKELNLILEDKTILSAQPTADGKYRVQQVLTQDLSFILEMTSLYELTNERPPSCHIIVFADQLPMVTMANPEESVTVRPDDTITVEFSARDDFGIAKAELVITDPDHPDAPPLKVIDIPLGDQQDQTQVDGQAQLDLHNLKIDNGAQLSYAVRVFDTKDGTAVGQQQSGKSDTDQNTDESSATADSKPAESNEPASESSSSNASASSIAKADQQDPDEQSAQDQKSGETNGDSKSDEKTANAASKPSETEQSSARSSSSNSSASSTAKADQKDSDEQKKADQESAKQADSQMTRRSKPGQCSTCKPKNVKIDEWAGSYAGQQREKQEIAIDEFLKQLEAELARSEQENQSLIEQNAKSDVWDPSSEKSVRKTVGHISKASQIALDLAKKSAGTPYAFMGLQLAEIDERHLGAATSKLREVAKLEAGERKSNLDSSQFHIRRARELLARLSRTYEEVKVNQRLDDAMTHIEKMHQVFIEDTFQLLGNARPSLNPKERKFLELELDEEFRNKLKALLEKKRDIQAELAKRLAENPEMLRRFMAKTRLDADSLRDQMTINANRQRALRDETQAALPDQPKASQDQVVASRKKRMIDEAAEFASGAALMSENFDTWYPSDLNRKDKSVLPLEQLFDQLTATVEKLSIEASADRGSVADAERAYQLLQSIQEELPKLVTAQNDHPKLTSHVTNRLAETGKLTTRISGWITKAKAIQDGDYATVAHVDQSQLTNDTAELGNKILNLKSWISNLTPEIGEMANELTTTMEDDLLIQEVAAEQCFEAHEPAKALEQQSTAVETFAKVEQQFDKLLDAIIAHLDSLPVNKKPDIDPNATPSVEELLAMLEDEKLATEGLGIPCCRPSNLSIINDWLSPSKGGKSKGSGGAAMARGAMAQSQGARLKSGQLKATTNAKTRMLISSLEVGKTDRKSAKVRHMNPQWNTLQSKLDDGLKQGRGQSPPEKYRSAIERYFEQISGTAGAEPTGKSQ